MPLVDAHRSVAGGVTAPVALAALLEEVHGSLAELTNNYAIDPGSNHHIHIYRYLSLSMATKRMKVYSSKRGQNDHYRDRGTNSAISCFIPPNKSPMHAERT